MRTAPLDFSLTTIYKHQLVGSMVFQLCLDFGYERMHVTADWTSITPCGDLVRRVGRSQAGEELFELASEVRGRRLGH